MMTVGVIVKLSKYEEEFETAKEMGIHSCQLVAWGPSEELTEELAARVLEKAKACDVTISALWRGWSGPTAWDLTQGPHTLGIVPLEYRKQRITDLKRGSDFAKYLGVQHVVTHMGFLPEVPTCKEYESVCKVIKEIALYYKKNKQYLLFETGQETPVTLLRTIETVATGNLGINLDPANLLLYGKGNPCDAVDVFGKYVMGMHGKDGMTPTEGTHLGEETRIGDGMANYPLLLKKLYEVGYDGPITIEREISGEKQLEDIRYAKKFLEDLIDKVTVFRVGLVGIGGMGFGHYRRYADLDNAKIVAVCDIRDEVAKEKVGETGLPIYTDMVEMIRNEKLDMVDIVTPSYTHADLACTALSMGVHVLCEKPMALDPASCKRMIAASRKYGKRLMIAHVVRFMKPYVYLAEAVRSGRLGKLVRLDMKRISSIPKWSFEDWMRDPARSGGVCIDLSIHDIDFMQDLLGRPKSFDAVHYTLKEQGEYIQTNFIYDDFLVTTEGTWYDTSVPFSATYYAVFENGYIRSDGKLIENGTEVKTDAPAAKVADTGINLSSLDGYGDEIHYFVECIKKGIPTDKVTLESSLYSIELCREILKKAKNI